MNNYDIIYADPPWQQEKTIRNVRPNQKKELDYDTLSIPEITVIMNSYIGKILFLWTIEKFLLQAEVLYKRLGFKKHCTFIWDKMNGPCSNFTVRLTHEYLFWCYKTPMLKIDNSIRGKFRTVIREYPERHSQKPKQVYEMIEKMYPDNSKIELFARKKRKGWSSFGKDL